MGLLDDWGWGGRVFLMNVRSVVFAPEIFNKRLRSVCFIILALLNLLSLSGCDSLFPSGGPGSVLSPKTGVLTNGRRDTLVINSRTYWPLDLAGMCLAPQVYNPTGNLHMIDSVGVGDRTIGDYYEDCSSEVEWKLWLIGSVDPGSYTIDLDYAQFRLVVLEENEFFRVEVVPESSAQMLGTTKARIVRLIRAPGFTAPIQLSLYQPPSGITGTFNPASVGEDSSFMNLTVDEQVTPGRKNLTVVGVKGNVTRVAFFTVDVLPASYVVTLFPRSMTLRPGQIGTTDVSVASQYLPATLSEVTIPPPYVTTNFSPNPTSDSSTMTVAAGPQAQAGTYRIAIAGTFSNGQQGRDTLVLRIDTVGAQVTTVLNSSAVLIGMDVRSPFGLAVGTAAYRSTNDGQTWNLIPGLPPPPFLVRDASIVGNLAIAAGGSGKIYVSTDAGVNWQERASGTTNQFFGTDLSPAGFGLAVGAQGTICRSINNGNIWASISSPSNETLWDVDFNGNTATIVGTAGTILRSTDVGVTWAQQTSGTTSHLHGVMFLNENEGIAVGDFGTILKTVNGGAQWISLNSGTTEGLFGIGLANSQKATAGGTFGLLIETVDGGQTWTPVSVPSQYIYEKVHVFSNNSALYLGQASTGSIILRRE
jgi:photosystem II stability/assembly factor-like uncharacterized protein